MRISKPQGDTGEPDPRVASALGAWARRAGSEHAALTAIAATRLLVPVVAVMSDTAASGSGKEADMALATLVGNDGRKAVPAFTGIEALRRWRADARPVPVAAARVLQAAIEEADGAVVIDVAGPVQFVVEGARLRALAAGQAPPLPHEDPDIRAEVAAVTGEFTLAPGAGDTDLVVILGRRDMAAAEQIVRRLAVRLRRGIEVRGR